MTQKEKHDLYLKALLAVHYEETDCFYKVYNALKITGNLRQRKKTLREKRYDQRGENDENK